MTTATRTPITSADELRALVRHHATTEPDPGAITARILDDLTPDEMRVVAMVALRDFVRRTIVQPVIATGRSATAQPSAERSYETCDGRRTRSRKVAAIRDWVAAELSRSVCVITETSQEWKHLGDCSAADLHALSVERDRKASQVASEGKRYERAAEAVEAAGAATLADLDRATIEAVLR